MENKGNKVEVVTDYKHIQIREVKDDGKYQRRVLHCGDDVSGESEQIQEQAGSLWTDEVKTAWTTYKAEQEALRSNP